MKEIELAFINHCEPPCGLGRVEFICPFCGEYTTDYGDVWYNFSCEGFPEDYDKDAQFRCEECYKDGTIIHLKSHYYLKQNGRD